MSVTSVNIRKYGADHRVTEYGLTEIVRNFQIPYFIQFGEYFKKIENIKLSNPIHITGFNVTVKMKYEGLYIFYVVGLTHLN